MEYNVVLGIISVVIGLAGYVPYFIELMHRTIKPHSFSWLVWTITQSTAFYASAVKGGGTGAWALGAQLILMVLVLIISLFRGEKEITRLDKASFIIALLGVGLWVITTNPLWSVAIVAGVDAAGFVPTIRKSYKKPYEESIWVYACTFFAFFISLFALQSVSLITTIYPVVICFAEVVLVATILYRRSKASR
jgi:hypothetical protein